MLVPEFNEQELSPQLVQPQLFTACIQQTEKDLQAYGIHIPLAFPGNTPLRELLNELQPQLHVILQRGTQVQEILYRVDVTEKLLQQALIACPEMPLEELLARLIILRELQKVITRQSFSKNDGPAEWEDV
jgi:hypothetical protein